MVSPEHLEPLLDGTPLAFERIKHAWPGLSTSDRAYLLNILLSDTSKQRAVRWPRHREQLIDLALTDDNAFIRYLAARKVSKPFGLDDQEYSAAQQDDPMFQDEVARFNRITSDPVGLVRSAHKESDQKLFAPAALHDAELFWNLPQTERLALVSGVKAYGEKIAALLLYAARHLLQVDAVTMDEVCDVLLQYLGGASITERVADAVATDRRLMHGIYSYYAWESVRALWEVIPHLPEPLQYILLECLPDRADSEPYIPSLGVLASLDDHQLEFLLGRDDVTLQELRRRTYEESGGETLRCAAVSSTRFTLLDSDISRLIYDLQEPLEVDEKKVEELILLSENCRGATLAQMEAILALLSNAPSSLQHKLSEGNALVVGRMLQTARARRLPPGVLRSEVHALRVFLLALQLAPIGGGEEPIEIPEALIPHQDNVVPGDPWQTYINLLAIVRPGNWRRTVGYLPAAYVRDVELPENDDNPDERRRRFDLLQGVQERVDDIPEQDSAELSVLSTVLLALSDQVTEIPTTTRKQIDEAIESRVNGLFRIVAIVGGAWLIVSLAKWLIGAF